MQWTSQNIRTRSGTNTEKQKNPYQVSQCTSSCPPTFYFSFPVPHKAVPVPRLEVWFCSFVFLGISGSQLPATFLLRAGSPPHVLCPSVGILWPTSPSGSVVGVTSHSIPVPNHRCSWVGQVPALSLLDQAPGQLSLHSCTRYFCQP